MANKKDRGPPHERNLRARHARQNKARVTPPGTAPIPEQTSKPTLPTYEAARRIESKCQ